MNSTEHDNAAVTRLAKTAVDRRWSIPAHEGHGPVTMALLLPEVRITDSEDRYIVISPRQSGLVGDRLSDIAAWLRDYDDESGFYLGERDCRCPEA
ncbi:hypothetical protein [Actinophytocola sediminis]